MKQSIAKIGPLVKHKFGLILTKVFYGDIIEEINKYIVQKPARAGIIAPQDVIIEPQITNIDPG